MGAVGAREATPVLSAGRETAGEAITATLSLLVGAGVDDPLAIKPATATQIVRIDTEATIDVRRKMGLGKNHHREAAARARMQRST